MRPVSRHNLAVAVLTGVCAVIACVVVFFTVLDEIVETTAPASVEAQPPPIPPLTEHVLLFIIDGLRFDYGLNPDVVPHYAKHMRNRVHGLVVASPVSMTSSAVRAIAGGQRSDLEQIVTNLSARRIRTRSLIDSLRDAGMRTAVSGDMTWKSVLGPFDEELFDENGIALEADNTGEILDAARKMVRSKPAPNLLVVHFIAPDHFGHAWGTLAPQYLSLLRKLDADMQDFFEELPSSWTVIAVSDHGQSDTGTHGTDTPLMRRTPLFAYGPGIASGGDLGSIDQVELAPTLSVLLGVPAPPRARGSVVLGMLDIEEDAAARIACAEASRVERAARVDGHTATADQIRALSDPCRAQASPSAGKRDVGRAAVGAYDRGIEATRASSNAVGTGIVVLAGILVFLAIAALAITRTQRQSATMAALRFVFWGFAVVASSVALTYHVERLVPPWDDAVRGLLFAVGNALLLAGFLWPARGAAVVKRWPALAFALVPGAIAWSYPTNTPHEAYAALVLGSLLWWFCPHADQRPASSILRGVRALPWSRVLLAVAALVALSPTGYYHGDPTPPFLLARPHLVLGLGIAGIVTWLVAGARARDGRLLRGDVIVAVVAAVGCLLLRPVTPAAPAIAAMCVLPLLAMRAALRGRLTLALGLVFASYAWVSRNVELGPLLGALIVLEAVGHAVANTQRPEERPMQARPWALVTLATVLFAGVYLARIGLQGGLDLTNIDYGVGGFGDPDVSMTRAGLAMVWKHAAGTLLLLGAFLAPLRVGARQQLVLAFLVTIGVRAGTVAWMLFACRTSYWSALRTMSELPSALIETLVTVGVLWVVTLWVREPTTLASEQPRPLRCGADA